MAYSENWRVLLDPQAAAPSRAARIGRLCSDLLRGRRLVASAPPASLGVHEVGGRLLQVLAHEVGDRVIVEFEPASPQSNELAPLYDLVRRFAPALQGAGEVSRLCELAAVEMKHLSGFGRCLVYRFDEEGHGQVLAAAADEGYDTYVSHRFPASDVPSQARELYTINHIRLIADRQYEPVALLAADGALERPVDMTQCTLRSVSPVHVEYMRNMGTEASMSVSIIVRGKLWGLISCHDRTAHFPSWPVRVACEHLGQLLSLQIEAKEDNARVSREAELRQKTLALVASLGDSDATLARLVAEPQKLQGLCNASGAAVIFDNQCWTCGDTPDHDALLALAAWLEPRVQERFETHQLAREWPEAPADLTRWSGLLAISISQVHRQYVLWFRPEIVQTIEWAGDPRGKQASDGRLHPRRSFATWREQVRGRSLPWEEAELHAVLELRQALISIILRRAEEMAAVATELGRVNKELEAFSYTVSHDLRAPMRHITGYVDLVTEAEGARLGERSMRYLSHVKNASVYAGLLVDALLEFSRMGRTALKPASVKLGLLVDELVAQARAQTQTQGRDVRIEVQSPLPDVWGDPLLVQVAVRNLLDNAVKYTATREHAEITIAPISVGTGDGIEVRDNGVGFQMDYVNKLFGVFQRLHKSETFEGTGIGLATVKRIVERHGGSVYAKGEVDRGAIFGLILPRKPFIQSETIDA